MACLRESFHDFLVIFHPSHPQGRLIKSTASTGIVLVRLIMWLVVAVSGTALGSAVDFGLGCEVL